MRHQTRRGIAQPPARAWRRLLGGVGLSLLVLVVVPLPFDIGLPLLPARWGLFERAAAALNNYRYTSYSAFNLWTTPLTTRPDVPLFKQPDAQPWLLGLSYQRWGAVLLAVAALLALACYWRRRADGIALPWASLTLTIALFALPTRIHERYLFPALVFAALLAALTPRARWLYAGISLTYLANLYYVYAQFYLPPAWHLPGLHTSRLYVYTLSLLNVGLLLYAGMRLAFRARTAAPAPAPTRAAVAGEEALAARAGSRLSRS